MRRVSNLFREGASAFRVYDSPPRHRVCIFLHCALRPSVLQSACDLGAALSCRCDLELDHDPCSPSAP